MLDSECVTYAHWNPDDPPWCCIHHVCPSNIAWILFEGETLYHLVPRLWEQDVPNRTRLPNDARRSDGMLWNVYRDKALCGLEIKSSIIDIHAFRYIHHCCALCWNARW